MRDKLRHEDVESDVCMLGAFPPPVHGMALLNAAMREHLYSRGGSPVVLDLAPASLSRSWLNRFGRVRKVAQAFLKYLREALAGRGNTLYVGLSGGWGQIYEALFVAVARSQAARIFLHHHSFAYIDLRKNAARLLVWLAGPGAIHIVGCEGQGLTLGRRYPTASITRVISNAAIMVETAGTKHRIRTGVKKIGFLSNISREKGIMEFLAVAARLEELKTGIEAYIAGPFEDDLVGRAVRETAARLHSVRYVGPKYGSEKESFWELIDVLLFPSKYSNETAPLVVYEAMSHGVPVVAWQRGCLCDMVPPQSGLVVGREQDFVAVAVEYLLKWQKAPAAFAEMSHAAAAEFLRQHNESKGNLDALLNELCGNANKAAILPSTA